MIDWSGVIHFENLIVQGSLYFVVLLSRMAGFGIHLGLFKRTSLKGADNEFLQIGSDMAVMACGLISAGILSADSQIAGYANLARGVPVAAIVIYLIIVLVNFVLYLFVAEKTVKEVLTGWYVMLWFLTVAIGLLALGSAATLAAPVPKP